jgi:hypothetical protein
VASLSGPLLAGAAVTSHSPAALATVGLNALTVTGS